MRGAMIDSQLRPSGITEPNLIAAIKYVPREMYVPSDVSSLAYLDEEVEVVPGRYLLAPLPGCLMMSALEMRPTERVLIVGGTTGYSARSDEHTSELQSLMRTSYAVLCLKK